MRKNELAYPIQKRINRRIAIRNLATVLAVLGSFALLYIYLETYDEIALLGICAVWLVLDLLSSILWGRRERALARDFGLLADHVAAVQSGELTTPLDLPADADLRETAERLNSIQSGLKAAVAEQTRSERMKVELISNVSHDLKTPLTSLISYIDLLSKEELPPQAMDYVHVLERKSQGLRRMVQDVFDLAKAASGEDVRCTRLDAVMCLRQVLADMEDTIQRSGRDIRLQTDLDRCIIRAEGSKLYRIYQNLLANALRYSMENTRVYIRVPGTQTEFSCCIQNTSSYEMHFTPEEITERFTRGDTMRSTEGSGLGLAIAKSFAEACGGGFRVAIDGDQFKAILTFPCCGSDAAPEA